MENLRSAFIDCSESSRLSPIRCNKVAYLMIIEYFGHFSIKYKRRYLNSQRISHLVIPRVAIRSLKGRYDETFAGEDEDIREQVEMAITL